MKKTENYYALQNEKHVLVADNKILVEGLDAAKEANRELEKKLQEANDILGKVRAIVHANTKIKGSEHDRLKQLLDNGDTKKEEKKKDSMFNW